VGDEALRLTWKQKTRNHKLRSDTCGDVLARISRRDHNSEAQSRLSRRAADYCQVNAGSLRSAEQFRIVLAN
jgi:hypothetical protein